MAERCVHGMDSRFCAICNRNKTSSFSSAGIRPAGATLDQILRFLNLEQVRATTNAVAEAIGVSPRALATRLGEKRPETSWVVDPLDALPVDYAPDQVHPALLSKPDIIKTSRELLLRLAVRLKKS